MGCGVSREPPTADSRIGVYEADDDPRHPRVDERAAARRRPAEVVAGLEGDVRGGSSGEMPGRSKGKHLRVRLASLWMKSLPDRLSRGGIHDDAADDGIGEGLTGGSGRELQGAAHVRLVLLRDVCCRRGRAFGGVEREEGERRGCSDEKARVNDGGFAEMDGFVFLRVANVA